MSYNGNVFYTVTSDDLTGTGSESDPYVVHSTKGFLYLTNYSFSKISLYVKYLELDCDVVLNDETFDKNGNPSDGDGVVYNHNPYVESFHIMDGKNHTIKGLYSVRSDNGSCLVRYPYGVQNLHFEDVYVCGTSSACIAYKARGYIENCSVKSGYLRTCAANALASIANYALKIVNCTNYATLYSEYYTVGGIITSLQVSNNSVITNCNNYGNIYHKQTLTVPYGRIGGILCSISNTSSSYLIKNCRNYGNIIAEGDNVAGIIALCHSNQNSELIVKNCINYGYISSKRAGVSGLCAYVYGNIRSSIMHCKNFGKIECNAAYAYAGIVGSIADDSQVVMHDCFSNMILFFNATTNATVKINNCKIIIKNDPTYLLVYSSNSKTDIDSVEIIIENDVSKTHYLFSIFKNMSSLKNVVVKTGGGLVKVASTKDVDCTIDGVIITGESLQYYGSNFSGFYFSWRTGKIGLIALDGRGSFQGKIDEQWLLGKGFEKKEI